MPGQDVNATPTPSDGRQTKCRNRCLMALQARENKERVPLAAQDLRRPGWVGPAEDAAQQVCSHVPESLHQKSPAPCEMDSLLLARRRNFLGVSLRDLADTYLSTCRPRTPALLVLVRPAAPSATPLLCCLARTAPSAPPPCWALPLRLHRLPAWPRRSRGQPGRLLRWQRRAQRGLTQHGAPRTSDRQVSGTLWRCWWGQSLLPMSWDPLGQLPASKC